MSYNVNNIIPFNAAIRPQGLGFANFASAMLFAPVAELPSGFAADSMRDYSTLAEMVADGIATTSETYKAAARWLGGIPATNSLTVWAVDAADANVTVTINKARDVRWWFWSFFTAAVYADDASVIEIATWSDSVQSFFMNCQTAASATEIRDPANTTNIANALTASGYRFTHTCAHATDAYAGISLAKWFAAVNYNVANSTITGEYKKLAGVAAEDLSTTANNSMTNALTKAGFYSVVDLQGAVDAGRYINSITHSTFGEYIDDVVNLAAFANALQTSQYNDVANAVGKLGQDPIGEAILIGSAKAVCESYIANGYLGPRNYTNPDNGLEQFTFGYEILTRPEDILNLSEAQRNGREAVPIRVRIFRKGAIHEAPVDVSVF